MGAVLPRAIDLNKTVPHPITAYVYLGFFDLAFTHLALYYGFAEGNPVLAHVYNYGALGFVKVAATLVTVLVSFRLWRHAVVRLTLLAANAGMALLVGYHLLHLGPRLFG